MSRQILRARARRHHARYQKPHTELTEADLQFRMDLAWLAGYDAAVRDCRRKQRARGNRIADE